MNILQKALLLVLPALVLTACAATPQSRIERDPASFAALPPEQQARVQQGGVGVGFDAAAVRLAMGEPDRIIERESAEGASQVWVYYTVLPGFNQPYCGNGFPYYGFYGFNRYCGPVTATQYEERARVSFKDGKVVSVDRAR